MSGTSKIPGDSTNEPPWSQVNNKGARKQDGLSKIPKSGAQESQRSGNGSFHSSFGRTKQHELKGYGDKSASVMSKRTNNFFGCANGSKQGPVNFNPRQAPQKKIEKLICYPKTVQEVKNHCDNLILHGFPRAIIEYREELWNMVEDVGAQTGFRIKSRKERIFALMSADASQCLSTSKKPSENKNVYSRRDLDQNIK